MNTLVIGCGNILKGDDGFGPAVIKHLENHYMPSRDTQIIDAGLACGEWLRPLIIDDDRPDWIIIIDTMDLGKEPGEIDILQAQDLPQIPPQASSHFFPDRNIIEAILETGTKITFVACQYKQISSELTTELSREVHDAVPKVAKVVAKLTGLKEKDANNTAKQGNIN